MSELGYDNSDDNHRQPHNNRANEKHRFASDLVNNELCIISIFLLKSSKDSTYHSRQCADEEDHTSHTSCKQCNSAAVQAETDENVGCIIDD